MKKGFKAGDKVRLKKGLVPGRLYGGMQYIKHMARYEGDISKITAVTHSGAHYIEGFNFVYTAEMLEKVK